MVFVQLDGSLNSFTPSTLEHMAQSDKTRISETGVVEPAPPDDAASGEHVGPWLIISREHSAAPHSQCASCGAIDRTGTRAQETA